LQGAHCQLVEEIGGKVVSDLEGARHWLSL
jgi:hypothetical protein